MSSQLVALCFDANAPLRLARFWADALHWEIDDQTDDGIGLVTARAGSADAITMAASSVAL